MEHVPVIDLAPLRTGRGASDVAAMVDRACRDVGFFCISGHGVDPALGAELEAQSRAFFGRPEREKAEIAMSRGGSAWRGWFPVGGELTSGQPDRKEGLYFGRELPWDDQRVVAGRPLHGPNLFPATPAGLRDVVLEWMAAMTDLGRVVMQGLGLALGLGREWFDEHLTADPITLFRIFHYPPGSEDDWGVGEHTDYGLLTVLRQDDCGGLQVKSRNGWIEVPADPDVFVCNIGDMLDRMTGGRYRSTPHRVKNTSDRGRLSFPFFFDPSWDAEIGPLPDMTPPADGGDPRWDGVDVHQWEGTYGDYLTAKVAKVFPGLHTVIEREPT